MKAQEKHFQTQQSEYSEHKTKADETLHHHSIPPRKDKQPKIQKNQVSHLGDTQFIPEHTRKPLEIPAVGSKIQTTYRGQTYEAVIVDDPSNKRMEGRSILFNGTVYRTLTAAAAHAISPGINSGSVWLEA